MIAKPLLLTALIAALLPAARGQTTAIQSAGVLGNSGEAGDTLVRYEGRLEERSPLAGFGVDSAGFLWAFGGTGAINRYSVDGRQLATFATPGKGRARMRLNVVGNQVLLLADDQLYSLPTDAESGAAFATLPVKAKTMSTSSVGNRIAIVTAENELQVMDAVTRQTESRGPLPEGTRASSVVLLPDGTAILDSNLKIGPDGETTRIKLPGGNPVCIDGKIYAFGWHTTIQRVDENGSPDPGVVLGGSSGSFIGSLPKDGEMHQPLGLVKIDDTRYATAGALGVIHILHWNPQRNAFEWVRRIGAIHRDSGLGVDRQGRVWWHSGYWNWNDGPATYPHNTLHSTADEGWQLAFLSSDSMIGLSSRNNKALLVCGIIDPEPRRRFDSDIEKIAADLPKKSTGTVVLGKAPNEEVVFLDADGVGARLLVGQQDSQFRKLLGKVAVRTADGAAPDITSLGRLADGRVLAGSGGALLVLEDRGDTLVEQARLTGWAGGKFGDRIVIATDGDRLWVSDTANNRVLLFALTPDMKLGAPAVFTGDDHIGKLAAPARISARGDRAVVLDAGNQRLVKLEAVAR